MFPFDDPRPVVVTVCWCSTPQVWDLGPGSEGRLSPQAQTLPGGHSDYVLSVCFSQDGKYIISGSKDRSVIIWDAKLMKQVSTRSSSSSIRWYIVVE